MEKNKGFAGSAKGYVRAVFSDRRRGYCLPVDLLRAHCRAVVRSGARERVARAFADYLVTDQEGGGPFCNKRIEHAREFLPECVSGGAWVGRSVGGYMDEAGGPLDAPDYSPSGAMRGADYGGFSGVVVRAALPVFFSRSCAWGAL